MNIDMNSDALLDIESEIRIIESTLGSDTISNLIRAVIFSKNRLALAGELIRSNSRYEEIKEAGLGFVASGSIGRMEALDASDFDLVTLCPEDSNEQVVRRLDVYVRDKLREALDCDVSKGKNFTGPTYLKNVASTGHIGGENDNVNLLTKRMLFLTESQPVLKQEMRNKFQRSILDAFLASSSTRRRYFASLNDEIVRHYRSVCIDYKSRIDWERKSWAIRYLKLRHSRKYSFFSLIMAMTALLVKYEAKPESAEFELTDFLDLPPTIRIYRAVNLAGIPNQLATIGFYDKFLGKMCDVDTRNALSNVKYSNRHEDACFQELKRNADRLHRGMIETIESLPANWRRHIMSSFLLHS